MEHLKKYVLLEFDDGLGSKSTSPVPKEWVSSIEGKNVEIWWPPRKVVPENWIIHGKRLDGSFQKERGQLLTQSSKFFLLYFIHKGFEKFNMHIF